MDSGVCEREDITRHAAEAFLREVCVCDTEGSLLVTLKNVSLPLLTAMHKKKKKHVGTNSKSRKICRWNIDSETEKCIDRWIAR